MALFLTADPHVGHRNIIGFCDRPFRTLDGQPSLVLMRDTLIERWNSTVGDNDDVIIVGDVAFGPPSVLAEYLSALKGTKHLVLGNHDRLTKTAYYRAGFKTVERSCWLHKDVFVVHNPNDWVTKTRTAPRIILHGHVHGLYAARTSLGIKFVNVGVDVRQFSPVLYQHVRIYPGWPGG